MKVNARICMQIFFCYHTVTTTSLCNKILSKFFSNPNDKFFSSSCITATYFTSRWKSYCLFILNYNFYLCKLVLIIQHMKTERKIFMICKLRKLKLTLIVRKSFCFIRFIL